MAPVEATQEYSFKPPSPPKVHMPLMNRDGITLPLYHGVENIDPMMEQDLRAIVQHRYVAYDHSNNWTYEDRRKAQEVLPFLYLGPATAKTIEWLRHHKITLLLAIRDQKSAQAGLLGAEKVAAELGIEFDSVNIANHQELIAAFPKANRVINEHLLRIYREQKSQNPDSLDDKMDGEGQIVDVIKGKVLVYCETGNERSAAVAIAYIMSMYGLDVINATHFVSSQRFCIALNDRAMGLLVNFHDILQAQRDVMSTSKDQTNLPSLETLVAEGYSHFPVSNIPDPTVSDKMKRGYGETIEDEDLAEAEDDMQRFGGRNSAPFMDQPDN